jgi:hypothetical protein
MANRANSDGATAVTHLQSYILPSMNHLKCIPDLLKRKRTKIKHRTMNNTDYLFEVHAKMKCVCYIHWCITPIYV